MEALARGLKFPPGSHEESVFIRYTERRASIEYLKILTIVNAIITAGNNIVAAVSESDQTPTNEKLKKSFDGLQELLVPHAAEDRKKKAQEAQSLLKAELDRGPITFRVGQETRKDLRQRKRRS